MGSFLDDLVADASGDAVPVATLLRRVLVVASRLENITLEAWVDHELSGYPDDALLPDYRAKRSVEVIGHFGGPAGSGLKNAPVPSVGFPKELRDGPLFSVEFRESVAALEDMASRSDGALPALWPADAVAYTNQLLERGEAHLYEFMGLQQAFRLIPLTAIRSILDTVRTRILSLSLSLESLVPDAGLIDAAASDPDALDRVVMNVYGGNVAVQSSHFQQQLSMPSIGDTKALFLALNELGISQEMQDELRGALEADEADGAGPRKSIGRRVKEWAGSIALGGRAQLARRRLAPAAAWRSRHLRRTSASTGSSHG